MERNDKVTLDQISGCLTQAPRARRCEDSRW